MASLQHSASIPVRAFGEREAPIRDAAALLASLRHLVEPDEIGLDVHPVDALPPLSLDAAYRHCVEITRINSRSFYLSSQLLPFEKRMAVRALYAFCRTSDDTVDRATDDPARALAQWVARVHAPHPPLIIRCCWHGTIQCDGMPSRNPSSMNCSPVLRWILPSTGMRRSMTSGSIATASRRLLACSRCILSVIVMAPPPMR
jgi:phytoene synthase